MTDVLTVGVNLLWCLPGGVGGSEEYLVRQLTGLRDAAPEIRARLFVLPGFAAAHRELAARHELVVASLDARRRSRRIVSESTWLPSRLAGVDVVHHGGGTVPLRSPGPVLLTMHDVQYRCYPEYLTAVKRQYLRLAIPHSVKRADVVAVPSEYVRGTVIEGFGCDPDRVVVVPHGVDIPAAPTPADELRERYGIGARRYVVYPALTHPHKNHRFLLDLLAGPWNDPDLALVLLGGRGLVESEVVAAIDTLGLGGRVVRPGRVPEADRDGLIAAAEALVFPSEYEGFGAPVIEAMALGTPVVCSDRAALPEVAGDAALVRPLEPDAWKGALDEVARTRDRAGRGRPAAGRPVHDAGVRRPACRGVPRVRRDMTGRPLRIVVLGPHFAPDTAPTGTILTRIVEELARRGHELHVVSSLPWYRDHAIEPGWGGRLVRREATAWGSISRVHPFPGADKRNLARRALGFAGFSLLAAWAGLAGGGWWRRADAVFSMSPPLTMGVTGRLVAWSHRAPQVFNIQDVFPDAAVETGAITNRSVIAVAAWLERVSYRLADAVTVLSDDLRANVVAKVAEPAKVHTIANFVDTERIRPGDRMTPYRAELGIGTEPVVLYAGNVGFSQSLDVLLETARARPEITVLVNGDGAARRDLEQRAAALPNVRFAGFVPDERLGELLATGDVHVVPLRRGLATVSVPSKTYSILAAGRPIVAAIDAGTEVPRILEASGAGIVVPPDDPARFAAAVGELLADPARARRMGDLGRDWVVAAASAAAVAGTYEDLVRSLVACRSGTGRRFNRPARR